MFDRLEWDQFHLRHAELHLGFLQPVNTALSSLPRVSV